MIVVFQVLDIEPKQLYRHCTVQSDLPWGLSRISKRAKLGAEPCCHTYRDDAAGAGTVAYVIDTGINGKHEEFEKHASKGPEFESSGFSSDDDLKGHGTHCAGAIASRAYGVAKKAKVIGVKVFGDKTESAMTSNIIKVLDFVVGDVVQRNLKGRAAVNLSLGGGESTAFG